jgi:hypothetical protein
LKITGLNFMTGIDPCFGLKASKTDHPEPSTIGLPKIVVVDFASVWPSIMRSDE